MYEIPFSDEGLGGFAYFFFGFIAFAIVFSLFVKMTKNQRPMSRINKRFVGTGKYLLIFFILAFLYYIGENFLHKPIVAFFNDKLQNTVIPLCIFSVSLLAFYASFVMIKSKKKNPYVLISSVSSALSFIITVYMFVNGNKLF